MSDDSDEDDYDDSDSDDSDDSDSTSTDSGSDEEVISTFEWDKYFSLTKILLRHSSKTLEKRETTSYNQATLKSLASALSAVTKILDLTRL